MISRIRNCRSPPLYPIWRFPMVKYMNNFEDFKESPFYTIFDLWHSDWLFFSGAILLLRKIFKIYIFFFINGIFLPWLLIKPYIESVVIIRFEWLQEGGTILNYIKDFSLIFCLKKPQLRSYYLIILLLFKIQEGIYRFLWFSKQQKNKQKN